tara:strand:+ start:403 stop:513 length:111 start_codon:yes stop_codon:yes gene_type:complete
LKGLANASRRGILPYAWSATSNIWAKKIFHTKNVPS